MYYNLWRNPPSPKASEGHSKIFLAIIAGAIIIGGCVYFSAQVSHSKISADVGNKNIIVPKTEIQNPVKTQVKTDSATTTAICGASDNTIVTKVIDGDTVVVEGGWHIRLLGMDADEKGYPCYLPAKTRLEDLVLAKQVVLERDVSDIDQYGRCLRYIFVGNINVDTQLVKEGLAVARFYKPDVKYRTEITIAERQAETSRIGCKWSGLPQVAN